MSYIDLRDLKGEELKKWKKAFEGTGVGFELQKKNDPTMIPDWEFEEYARTLAEDIGAIDGKQGWPLYCIDWERAAKELMMDYIEIEVDSRIFYFRAL